MPVNTAYAELIARIKQTQANCGQPGFNEYGCPLHACNGVIADGHYWAWLRNLRLKREAAEKLAKTCGALNAS